MHLARTEQKDWALRYYIAAETFKWSQFSSVHIYRK